MSINKLSHLKDGDKIYLEVEKVTTKYDDEMSMCFESNCANSIWVNDDDIFYTLDDLKKLANDGIPKQGEIIEIYLEGRERWNQAKFVCFYKGSAVIHSEGWGFYSYKQWRLLPQKTELTLAEVEERLGLDAGSLIIK